MPVFEPYQIHRLASAASSMISTVKMNVIQQLMRRLGRYHLQYSHDCAHAKIFRIEPSGCVSTSTPSTRVIAGFVSNSYCINKATERQMEKAELFTNPES